MKEHEDERDLGNAPELLRKIEPSLEARLENHRVVAAELERLQVKRTPVSWWKRSITLPIPVAISLGVLACVVAVLPWASRYSIQSHQPPIQSVRRSIEDLATDAAGSRGAELVSTTTYLCGVGPIERETIRWHEE